MTRIQFRNTDHTNTYTVPINPVDVDIGDSSDYELVEIIDGAPIRATTSFDGRQRWLEWDSYEYVDTAVGTRFKAMLSELRSYVGSDKELHLQDIEADLNRGWKDIMVDNLEVTTMPGAGNIRKKIKLFFHYTEEI